MTGNTNDTITAVRGIEVGHCTDARRPTGCSGGSNELAP